MIKHPELQGKTSGRTSRSIREVLIASNNPTDQAWVESLEHRSREQRLDIVHDIAEQVAGLDISTDGYAARLAVMRAFDLPGFADATY